ncbi:MAG: hypothetical protein ACI38Y_07900 [Candidatus Methanomethylophilaceae archaeon]
MEPEIFKNTMELALSELDRCLGHRKAGRVVSGNHAPSYKDIRSGEDPLYLTLRVLIVPMMQNLGYGRVSSYDVADGCVPGLAMAASPMNSPLSHASSRVMTAMRTDGSRMGIATDGFRWAKVSRSDVGMRVTAVSDLRPYYIEVLDRSRFREVEPVEEGELILFSESFMRSEPSEDVPRTEDGPEGPFGIRMTRWPSGVRTQ